MRAKHQAPWSLWQVRGSTGRHRHGYALAGKAVKVIKAAMVWLQGQAKRSEYSMSKAQLLAKSALASPHANLWILELEPLALVGQI